MTSSSGSPFNKGMEFFLQGIENKILFKKKVVKKKIFTSLREHVMIFNVSKIMSSDST
jgi:hypothetical protein